MIIFCSFLQYRAAVSSVHSTPSKSFILTSSPNSTLLSHSSTTSHHMNMINNVNHNRPSPPPSTGGGLQLNKKNNLSSSTQQLLPPHAYALQQKQRSFLTFGFGAGGSGPSRRESHVNVNVTPTSHEATSDTPEIRKYKKRFNSEILCAALWGVNLLIGTENGLMLLDRSGQGKVCSIDYRCSNIIAHQLVICLVLQVYQLISRRRFQQMEVLEGQNILVTISGKKNRVRVYYLSWLKSKILRTDGLSDVSSTISLH